MLRILKPDTMVPGGYQYTQSETGRYFGGNNLFKSQCVEILAHRKGNHLARATMSEVAEDLMAATCARLPKLCGEITFRPPPPPQLRVVARTAKKPVPQLQPAKPAIQPTSPASQMVAPRKTRRCGACGGRKTGPPK